MPAPAHPLQQVRNAGVRTGTAVIKGEQRRPSLQVWKFSNCRKPRNDRMNNVQMLFEFGKFELVNGSISTWESAGFEITGRNNVIIQQKYDSHFLSFFFSLSTSTRDAG